MERRIRRSIFSSYQPLTKLIPSNYHFSYFDLKKYAKIYPSKKQNSSATVEKNNLETYEKEKALFILFWTVRFILIKNL